MQQGISIRSALNTGSSGQRLRHSHAGAFFQKWRENRKGVSPAPPLPLSHSVGLTLRALLFRKLTLDIKLNIIYIEYIEDEQ